MDLLVLDLLVLKNSNSSYVCMSSEVDLRRVTKLPIFLLIIILRQFRIDIYDRYTNTFHLIYYLVHLSVILFSVHMCHTCHIS